MSENLPKNDDQWRRKLSPEEYRICREKGTERPFTGEYLDSKAAGTYCCKCCGAALFSSETKYDSGSGWPSFFRPIADNAVRETLDNSHGMVRMEVTCPKCDSHLGHVFTDGPRPTGLRYCVNSASLSLSLKAGGE
ncbi:MAG: peptide-methionine (R)-S-oxide reductase MsrB [Cellvibrionaceae bacterium]|nr:peptide-methionine (R)-S-oxide reductase MsrB [Cellvibrionaceae bacterium]